MGYLRLFLLTTTTLVSSHANLTFGQMAIYNSDFQQCSAAIQTKGELADSLKLMGVVDRVYEIQGSNVIEYYEMNTARFLGFAGDTAHFDLRRLPYLTRTPMMRRFVRAFGPETAHDIRQGAFVPGMLMQDIVALYGWPAKRRKKRGVSIWTYKDFELHFDRQSLVEAIMQSSGS